MLILITILWICWTHPIWQAQEPSNPQPLQIVDPVKFDEWGDILFSDEKARLYNAALYVQKQDCVASSI